MTTFEQTLQDLVNKSTEDKVKIALDAYTDLLPVLRQIDPEHGGMVIAFAILGTAVAADGKFSAEEQRFIKALMEAHGAEFTDDEIFQLMQDSSTKEAYNMVKKINDVLPAEKSASLVTLIAAISSIDDKIAKEEVMYIADLLNMTE